MSEAKRNCGRATDRGKEARSERGGLMNKNRIAGTGGQGERTNDREALVAKARRRRSGSRARKVDALTWGDLASCLKGQRSEEWSEESAAAIVATGKPVKKPEACNVYVQSKKAGERVMALMRRELTRLRLRINEAKSAVDRPWNRRFLGFTFRGREGRRRVSPRAEDKLKDRIRELTNRNRGASLQTVAQEVTQYLRGWKQYFGICQVPSPRERLDKWIRARLRLLQVKQWKRGTTAYPKLIAMGAPHATAIHAARHLRRWCYSAHSPGLQHAMPAAYFDRLGIPRLAT